MKYDELTEITQLICEATYGKKGIKEMKQIRLMLEDQNSPITQKYIRDSKEFMSSNQLDIDYITRSKGNVNKVAGADSLVEVVKIIATRLQSDSSIKYAEAIGQVQDVLDTYNNLDILKAYYQEAFHRKNEQLMNEYTVFVFSMFNMTALLLCAYLPMIEIEPTTSGRSKHTMTALILNPPAPSKNELDNLRKVDKGLVQYNKVATRKDYKDYLRQSLDGDRDNFVGSYTALGVATVGAIALSIIPITRELVYYVYNFRGKFSDFLDQQAYFLELNRANVEYNNEIDPKKKELIIIKQQNMAKKCLNLSDKIRVTHELTAKSAENMNVKNKSTMSLDNMKREINTSSLELM